MTITPAAASETAAGLSMWVLRMLSDEDFAELPDRETAWQARDRVAAYRKQLLAAGYWPLPVNGKRVQLDDWVNARATNAIIDTWSKTRPDHLNTGILNFNTPGLDLDITDEAAAEDTEVLAKDRLGETPVRIGMPPKRVLLFRADVPFAKMAAAFTAPNGTTHKVEILGAGQQVVVNGIHPGTGQPYRWHGGEPGLQLRREDLPRIIADNAAAYLVAATEMLIRKYGWTLIKKTTNSTGKQRTSAPPTTSKKASVRERAYAEAALDNVAAELAATAAGGRNDALNKRPFRLGTMIARGWIPRAEVEAVLYGAAMACGLVQEDGEAQTRKTLASGIEAGMASPHADLPEDRQEQQNRQETDEDEWQDAKAESPPLVFVNIAAWQNQPIPNQPWTVRNRIPAKTVTLLSGEGAVGKSILALQLGVAEILSKDWLGSMPEPGPVLMVPCEDDPDELWRRLARIADHYNARFSDFRDMHLLALAGQETLMATPDRSGLIHPTKLFARVHAAACDIKPKLIVLDNAADIFGGNENNRAQVRHFISILRKLAIDSGAGVLLTSHPSLTGINTGTGLSGSTAWDASVRSRLYFKRAITEKDEEPDPDLRVLEIMKANYGPVGETINVRWENGVFVPVGGVTNLEKLAAEQAAQHLFLSLLSRFTSQGRKVSDKPNANNYAPAIFAKEKEAREAGIRRAAFETAMRRLFAADKIRVETYGSPSRGTSHLVLK